MTGQGGCNDRPTGGRVFFLLLLSRFCILVVCETYPRCLITWQKVFYKWMKIYLKNVLKSPLKVDEIHPFIHPLQVGKASFFTTLRVIFSSK